jgi:hypothetical protein
MKIKLLLPAVLLFGIFLSTYGQDEKQDRWKVTSVGINSGFAGTGTANTMEDYINLSKAVKNPKLFIDPSKYRFSRYNFAFGGDVSLRVYLGLTPYDKKKGNYNPNRELRFSFGTGSGSRRSFNYYQYDHVTVDTFQSVNGNNTVLADSSMLDRYLYQEFFNEVSLGVSYLFKTPFERRFQFHAGGALEYAYAYRTYVRVEHRFEESLIYYEPGNPPDYDEPEEFLEDDKEGINVTRSSQNTNMKGSTHFVRASVPLGVNFRIARKEQSFFNNVYLWFEMNPGVEVQLVSNDKAYVNPYYGMALLGVTYRW